MKMGKFFDGVKKLFKSPEAKEIKNIISPTPNYNELMKRYANNPNYTQMDYGKRMMAKNKTSPFN